MSTTNKEEKVADVSTENIYRLNGRVPLKKAIPFGLQHVLAMFVSNLAPVLIVCSAALVRGTGEHLTSAEITQLLQCAMFVAGIGTCTTLEPSDLAEAMMEYLDCECTYFPSMTDDDPIMSAYNYAKRESVKEGFVPVLIKADDEILWECLIMNSNPDSDGEDDFAFDPDKVAEYRKKMLSAPVENSKAVLEEMIGQRKEEAEDDDMDWDEEILGEMEGGYDNRRFSSYWNSDNNMTYPLILAKIPVKNPWEIFAYLPFGGWNECPNTPELMAVAKYWFEQHEAVPAAMSHDELEFLLPAPVSEKEAIDVAVELYGFCPDVIDQGPEDATVGALADVLRQSTVWYFWWG